MKRVVICILAGLAVALPLAAPAQQGKELTDAASKNDAAVDKKLNAAYRKLVRDIAENDPNRAKIVIDQLREAQRAWLKFRDAQVQFVGLYKDIGSSTARAAGLSSYNEELTKARIRDLADVPDPF